MLDFFIEGASMHVRFYITKILFEIKGFKSESVQILSYIHSIAMGIFS